MIATAARASRPWPGCGGVAGGNSDIGQAYPRPEDAAPPSHVAFLWRNRGGAGRAPVAAADGRESAVPGWDNPATDQEDTWTTR